MASILLVDDNRLMRRMLKELIEFAPDLRVRGEGSSIEEGLQLFEQNPFDVVLIDISLQGREGGIELIRRIRKINQTTPILSVSLHEQALFEEKLREAGAQGYLMKQDAVGNIIPAIRHLLNGETYWIVSAGHE